MPLPSVARSSISFIPVVGPVVDGIDAVFQGDYVGATVEAGSLALDVLTIGQATTARATSKIATKAACSSSVKQAVKRSWRSVIKTAGKRKLAQKAKLSSVKIGCTAAKLLRDRVTTAATFEASGSDDAKLHAKLAYEVYHIQDPHHSVTHDGVLYRCVGLEGCRAFFYAPEREHLVLAEGGTNPGSLQDWGRDLSLAFGTSLAALSSRALASKKALAEQRARRRCRRVTATGHSLGGTLVTYLGSNLSGLDAVHAFNPGGYPDLTRSLSALLRGPGSGPLRVHNVLGDPISSAFLPLWHTNYAKREGFENEFAHKMIHFL